MVTKIRIAVFCLVLVVLLASCGGGGTSQSILGSPQPTGGIQAANPVPDGGQSPPMVQMSDWEMGDLPGTIPDPPKDIASVIAQSEVEAQKATSAILTTIGAGSASTTSPVGGGAAHGYVASDGNIWAEAQDTSVETEYHVHGTVTNLNLEAGGVSYATIGIVDFFTYNYAINGAPGAPKSEYLFNQNVYLMIRRDAGGNYWVRLGDYNSRWGSHEALVTMPFDYDLMIQPTNPVVSVPGAPPYTTHDIGLATLSINGAILGSSVIYGNNNWGWFRALTPELFDMPNGGAMLMGQVYASGDTVTSALDFSATLESGPLNVADPSDWWCYGQNQTNHRLSTFNGPQTNNELWRFTGFGADIDTPPVVGADGTIYQGCKDDLLYAINPNGTLKWTAPVPWLGYTSSPLIGPTGTIYVASRFTHKFTSLTDNGATATTNWTLTLDSDPRGHPALGHNGIIYLVTNTSVYAIRDDGPNPTVMWTYSNPFIPLADMAPAIADDGTIFILSGEDTLIAFRDDGASFTILDTYFFSSEINGSSPVIAPDGTIYVPSDDGLTALTFDGATFSLKWSVPVFLLGNDCRMALGPTGRIYVNGGEQLYSVTDNGGSATVNWWYHSGSTAESICVSADGIIYLANDDNTLNGEHFALIDNGSSWSLLWSNYIGGRTDHGAAPILVSEGRLVFSTEDGILIAYEDGIQIDIDCTSLPGANFYLHRPDDTVISGPHDTDVVYNASGDLANGDQFYVSFGIDGTASPNDLLIYPTVPASGLITVNPGNLGIDLAIAPYYTNPGGTRQLDLNPGTYNRVTNDLTSLGHALYNLTDTGGPGYFAGPYDTDSSGTDQLVLRDGVTYRPQFGPDAYPTAGSNAAFSGSPETIYPTEWTTGDLLVNGDIIGGGAAAAVVEQGTVLGDYFTQAGLVNTLDSDAFCRFEVDMTVAPFNYGYWDTAGAGTWIVSIIPGLDDQADPWNTAAFARGTRFQVRNTAPGGSTIDIDVDPGQLLDGATSITRGMGFSGNTTLNVIPVRVWDDPALPDPNASVTWAGAGWDVGIEFLLQYGQGPYTVEFDADYGAAWDDGTAGHVYTLAGSPFAATGLFSDSVSISLAAQIPGNYSYAIRVTDNNADTYTYIWPGILALNLPSGWNVAVPSPDTTDDTGLHTSMTFIGGNPAIAYYNFTNGDLMYVRSTDVLGGGWGTPVVVASTDDVGRYCSLADIGGIPAICYYDITNGRLLYTRAADAVGSVWTGAGSINNVIHQDPPPPFTGSGVGQFCSMAMVSGRPAVSYYDASFGGLRYARAANAVGSSWGAAGFINVMVHNPGSGMAGWDTSLAVINGNPAISYHYRTGGASGQLWYARSDDADGATWAGGSSIRMLVDNGGPSPGGPVGEYTSLAMVNGQPAISYYIAKAYGDVRYVRAGDATGSTWTTYRMVHSGAGTDNIGMYTSLAVINGLPAVSYYHAANGDLMYCSATNADGSTWGANEIADSTGFTGGHTSLLEVGGEPAISYYDFTNGDLEYVKHWP